MKKFRNACWIIGFMVFGFASCCGDSEGIAPYITVAIGLVIMAAGTLTDAFLVEEEVYER